MNFSTRALIDCIAFFGLAGDDEIDQDVAVRQLEQIGAILQQMDEEENRLFRSEVRAMAEEEQRVAGTTVRANFLQSLPHALGLV